MYYVLYMQLLRLYLQALSGPRLESVYQVGAQVIMPETSNGPSGQETLPHTVLEAEVQESEGHLTTLALETDELELPGNTPD